MQKRRIAAFDIDEVLYPLLEVFLDGMNKRFDIDLPIQNCPFYSFPAYLEHHHPKIHKRFEKNGGFLAHAKWVSSQGMLINVPPYEGIPKKLKEINENGLEIAIVTFRGTREKPDLFYNDGPKETLAWLGKYKIPYQHIRFTDEKDKALRDIEIETDGEIVYFAEDLPKHVMAAASKGYQVALVDKPYNQRKLNYNNRKELEFIKGRFSVRNWKETLDYDNVVRVKSVNEINGKLK